jgi:hypothetical protein
VSDKFKYFKLCPVVNFERETLFPDRSLARVRKSWNGGKGRGRREEEGGGGRGVFCVP